MGGRVDYRAAAFALLVAWATALTAQSAAQPGKGASAAEGQRGGGEQQGFASTIKVHGDWTIVVRNRDGSVASTANFENSIVGGGSSFFARMMARQAGQFYWGVRLENLCGTAPTLKACLLAEPASAGDSILSSIYQGAMTQGLTISNPTSGPNAYKFVLTGSFTSANTGQITRVGTETVTPSGTADNIESVTGTTLQAPISVQAGQTVDVTVVISFS